MEPRTEIKTKWVVGGLIVFIFNLFIQLKVCKTDLVLMQANTYNVPYLVMTQIFILKKKLFREMVEN